MIWIVVLCCFILLNVVGFFITASPASAAVPPRQEEDRAADARYIIVGHVRKIATVDVTVDWGTDHQYTATVDVIAVEKGDLQLPPASELATNTTQSIEVHYWQYGDRLLGWSGDAGQAARLVTGSTVRLFLWQDAEGQLNLLTPNGWDYVD